MSKEAMVFVLGALVFLSPYMGFPREYKEWFFIIAGLLLMVIGYRLRRLAFLRSIDDGKGEQKSEVYTESRRHIVAPEVKEEQQLHL